MMRSLHGQDRRVIRIFFLTPIMKIASFIPRIILAGLPFVGAFSLKDALIEGAISGSNWHTICLVFLNLGLSLFYVTKILSLNSLPRYGRISFGLGGARVTLGLLVLIFIINFFISDLLLLKYEVFNFKHFVYMFIIAIVIFRFIKINPMTLRVEKLDLKRN